MTPNSAPTPRHSLSGRPAAHFGQLGSTTTPSSGAAVTPTVLLSLLFARGLLRRYWHPSSSALGAFPPHYSIYIKGWITLPPYWASRFHPRATPRHHLLSPSGLAKFGPTAHIVYPRSGPYARRLMLRTSRFGPGFYPQSGCGRWLTPGLTAVTTQPIASGPLSTGHHA